MLIIGILCLVVAAISYFRYLSEKTAILIKIKKIVKMRLNGNVL